MLPANAHELATGRLFVATTKVSTGELADLYSWCGPVAAILTYAYMCVCVCVCVCDNLARIWAATVPRRAHFRIPYERSFAGRADGFMLHPVVL